MDICFGKCLLSEAEAYEVSGWFRRIQVLIERESSRVIRNISNRNLESRKKKVMETTEVRIKWCKLGRSLVLLEIAKKKMEAERRNKGRDRARRLWMYMTHAYRINCMVENLKTMKPKRRPSRGKRRWVSLAKRFLRKSQIDLLVSESQNMDSYSTEVEISDSEMHSQSFQKWQDLSNDFMRTKHRRNIELEAQRLQIWRARMDSWRQLSESYVTQTRREEMSISAENLRAARDTWMYIVRLYRQHVRRERITDGRETIEIMHRWQKWSKLARRKHVGETIHRELACQEATEHGASFLMDKLFGMEELVQVNVRNGFGNYKRTMNSDFWRTADFTGYSLTRKMMFDSINTILPKLSSAASETATVFSKCQTVLTRSKLNSEKQSKTKQKKQRDLHVIINFTCGDHEFGLLDSDN